MKEIIFFLVFSVQFSDGLLVNVTNKQLLYNAFSNVFNVQDQIEMNNDIVLSKAILELSKMGVTESLNNLCTLDAENVYDILMKAALGEYILSLKDPNDWVITLDNVETGQLIRKRSFSATQFAILETLLIISIVALGRVLWIK